MGAAEARSGPPGRVRSSRVVEAAPVDPRDVGSEEGRPAYRVYFWDGDPTASGSAYAWRSDEWRVTGADDVGEVLAWASADQSSRRFELLVEVGRTPGVRVVRLSGLNPTELAIRRATASDSEEAANVWLRARFASMPAIPPPMHSETDIRAWFRKVVLPERELWLAADASRIVAVLVLDGDRMDQLYIHPACTGWGIGSMLVAHAKDRRPSGLQLWTFETNTGARRFYERHGFLAVDRTAGDNEEGAPDVLYRWPGSLER